MDHQVLYESLEQQPQELQQQPQEQLENYEGIGILQDQILAVLPIPSAILSVFGSCVILYMAFSIRKKPSRQWTTYTRLLIGLSCCDILSSVSFGLSAFMRRPSSERAFAFGNDATCTATGAFIQFSFSNFLYNAMLSFYFLATVRFGMKHTVIAKRFEPIMHFVSLGYPLVTSVVGAIMGMYRETSTGMGCWVNQYPEGCGNGPDQEKCRSAFIGFLYFGLPYIFSLASIDINNLIIWLYVRKQRKPLLNKTIRQSRNRTASDDYASSHFDETMSLSLDRQLEEEEDESSCSDRSLSNSEEQRVTDGIVVSDRHDADDAPSTIVRITAHNNTIKNHHPAISDDDDDDDEREQKAYKGQMRRLQLVSSQAFLFVLSYLLCNTWMGLLGIAEGATNQEDEPKLMNDIYGLMVLNAIFAPLQGFLNMLVYMRPKYVKARHQFPNETRAWAFRRAVLGDSVRPEQRVVILQHHSKKNGNNDEKKEEKDNGPPAVSDSRLLLASIPEQEQGHHRHTVVAENDSNQQDESSSIMSSIISNNGIDQTHHMVPLPKSTMVSSLTASLGDFSTDDDIDDEDKDEETTEQQQQQRRRRIVRTKGAFEVPSSSSSSMHHHHHLSRRFHFQSSLEYMGKSLEAISELTESIFDPISLHLSNTNNDDDSDGSIRSINDDDDDSFRLLMGSSEKRWKSSSITNTSPTITTTTGTTTTSRVGSSSSRFDAYRKDDAALLLQQTNTSTNMGLVAPRRIDSDYDIIVVDDDDDDINDEEKEEISDAAHDETIYDSDKFEDVAGDLLLDNNNNNNVDTPISIPLRRMSLSLDDDDTRSSSSSISSSSSLNNNIIVSSEDDEDDEDDEDNGEANKVSGGNQNEESKTTSESSLSLADTPIRAPRRKLSPIPTTRYEIEAAAA